MPELMKTATVAKADAAIVDSASDVSRGVREEPRARHGLLRRRARETRTRPDA